MRRYDDPIEVRTASDAELGASGSTADPRPPVAFLWRDRLYVVRGVLAHWYERRVWWREAAASALLGLRSELGADRLAATAQGAEAPGGFGSGFGGDDGGRGRRSAGDLSAVLPAPRGGRRSIESAERAVWRVEAAAGRSSPVGVYDLVHDPVLDLDGLGDLAAAGDRVGSSTGWRLVRLDD